MKSTPMRGVKETLKPDAYKQWERARLRRTRSLFALPAFGLLERVLCGNLQRGGGLRETASSSAKRGRPKKTRLTFGEPVTAYLLHNGSASWSCEQA